eukprot:m.243494 g.243494  ORF g.243494 m.243494 type:complete len:60 (-) comp26609_c0_seq1:53-232(-)
MKCPSQPKLAHLLRKLLGFKCRLISISGNVMGNNKNYLIIIRGSPNVLQLPFQKKKKTA